MTNEAEKEFEKEGKQLSIQLGYFLDLFLLENILWFSSRTKDIKFYAMCGFHSQQVSFEQILILN